MRFARRHKHFRFARHSAKIQKEMLCPIEPIAKCHEVPLTSLVAAAPRLDCN